MGGGKGGGGSKSVNVPSIAPNPYEEQLASMASNMWNVTWPVRNYFTEDWQKFFRPEEGQRYDPYALPGYKPLYGLARTGIEDQYGAAKENILAGVPRGGGQDRALSLLESGRAKDVGSLQAQIASPLIQDISNKAYGAGWQTGPTQALGGMGTASQQLNAANISQQQLVTAAALQEAQASRAASSAKGSGVGSMLGKGLGSVAGSVIPGIGTALGGAIGGLGGSAISSGMASPSLVGVSNAYTPRTWW
jgi:hypothetical protein